MKCTEVYIYIYVLFNDTVVAQNVQAGGLMFKELHKMWKKEITN
jgi:hypothetical protein